MHNLVHCQMSDGEQLTKSISCEAVLCKFYSIFENYRRRQEVKSILLVYTLGFSEKSHDLVYGMTCEDENYKMIIIITITYKN